MRKQITKKLVFLLAGLFCLGMFVIFSKNTKAANPTTINFQGKVVNSDGTNVTNGSYTFIFRLYDSSSPTTTGTCSSNSSCWWEETDTITVTNGVFQVELGGGCAFTSACNSSHSGINFNTNNALYLTMKFNGDSAGFMSPTIHLTTSPYAFNADNLGGLSSSAFAQLGSSNTFTNANTFTPTGTNGLTFNGDDDSSFSIADTVTGNASNNGLSITWTDNGSGSNSGAALKVINAANGANAGAPAAIAYLLNSNNTADTIADGLLVEQNGSSSTLTNGVEIKQTAGTLTNGLTFTGTYTKLINSTNFNVSNAGAVTAVGVDAGSGLLQGSLGLTITGATTSINASSNFDTNINTGNSTGTITIGNSSSTALKLGKFASANGVLYISATDGTTAELTAGAGAQCLQSNGGNTALVFSSCGGGSATLQTAYDSSSSPATITLADGKNIVFAAADTTTDPSIIFNLQCVTSCGSTGVFDVQNAGTSVFTVSPNSGNITLAPKGAGDVALTLDADTNLQITASSVNANVNPVSIAATYTGDQTSNGLDLTITDNASASTGTLYGLSVTNADNSTNTGVPDAIARLVNKNTAETVADGLLIEQNGSGGTLTNGLEIKQTAGTLNNGLTFTGTFTNQISGNSFSISNVGAVTAGTYNTNTFSSSSLQFGAASTATIQSAASQALTVTAHGTSTWSTDSGNLSLDAASALNLGPTNATSIVLGGNTSGTITEKVANSSTTAYKLQTAGGTVYLTADTTDGQVIIGSGSAGNSTGYPLVLDSKTGTSDTTEVDGGIYYNTDLDSFRCGRDGAWSNCAINEIDHSFDFSDDFAGGALANAAASACGVGNLGWWFNRITSGGTKYSYTGGAGPPTLSHDHPGFADVGAGAANGDAGMLLFPGGNNSTCGQPTAAYILDAGDVIKSTVAVGVTASGKYRVGVTNQVNATDATSGVWWEFNPTVPDTKWRYCYASNGSPTCADSGVTAAAGTWVKLEIRIISSTAVDFIINGTKTSLTGITVDLGGTNKLTPGIINIATTTTATELYVDYFQWRGVITTAGGR